MIRHNDQWPTAIPTLRSRLLGCELRRIREEAQLTVAEFAALIDQESDTVRELEGGLRNDTPARDSTVWCPWGTLATSVITRLCRDAERIDIFAPLGINPVLAPLDRAHAVAYVHEATAVDRRDVTVRVIRNEEGPYPGIDHHPLTRFSLPGGPAIILYAYLHAAQFTDEEQHLLSAYSLFERLADFTGTAESA